MTFPFFYVCFRESDVLGYMASMFIRERNDVNCIRRNTSGTCC